MELKNKGIIIVAIIFFLLLNTSYFWEGKLGVYAFPAFFILAGIYAGLAVALLRQLYFLLREKLRQKNRLILIAVITFVLVIPIYKPMGLIDFDNLEGPDVLIAEREGSANCYTTLKLKDNFTFREISHCFGASEVKGTFRIVQDTIYFENVIPARGEKEYFRFAVIKPVKSDNTKILGDLVNYKDNSKAEARLLWITKNELHVLGVSEQVKSER